MGEDLDSGVSRVGFGDWQVAGSEGCVSSQRNKGWAPRNKGDHGLSGISKARGVLGQQRGLRTVEEWLEKRLVVA